MIDESTGNATKMRTEIADFRIGVNIVFSRSGQEAKNALARKARNILIEIVETSVLASKNNPALIIELIATYYNMLGAIAKKQKAFALTVARVVALYAGDSSAAAKKTTLNASLTAISAFLEENDTWMAERSAI